MEITLSIPKNTYKVPTEVRAEIVQKLCNFFLGGSILHPYSDGPYRRPNQFYWKTPYNGAEVKAAFKALIDAGYHIFRVYEFGSWMGYKLSVRPFYKDGVEVFEFTDFID
jgi:hypothetical protein